LVLFEIISLNGFRSYISDNIVATQTLEYWLRSYVSELETNAWNEDISPSAWLASRFAITLEKANTIVNSVSEEYLQCQMPQYWIKEWIKKQTNPVSHEFETFIKDAPANTLISYGTMSNLFIVDKIPNSDDTEEFNLFLTELSRPSSDTHTCYFHTTDLNGTESINEEGIHFGKCNENQDFGRTPSFYLHDEFRWAIEWKFCAILIYDIPNELLQNYDHLNLSQDLRQ
jgi:hypothetical protein